VFDIKGHFHKRKISVEVLWQSYGTENVLYDLKLQCYLQRSSHEPLFGLDSLLQLVFGIFFVNFA